jgi:hypothetical protein
MQKTDTYPAFNRIIWTTVAVTGFLAASFSAFVGVAAYFFLPDRRMIVLFGLLAVILDIGTSWTIHKRTGRGLRVAMLISSTAVIAGTILISLAIWREHWAELVWEILRSTGITR